ncbi:hypothetical protein HDU93_004936, partial [Gonapodya sp. JEL0774]
MSVQVDSQSIKKPATRPRKITASLNFIDLSSVPAGEKPSTYLPAADGSVKPPNFQSAPYDVTITDLRSVDVSSFTLDKNGFEIVKGASAVKGDEFWDQERREKVYLPEVEDIVKKATGATRTKVFDVVIRSPTRGNQQAIPRVHGDYTTRSGAGRLIEHMPPQDIDRLLKGRFAVINLWRPIVTAIDTPLAIADATTSP